MRPASFVASLSTVLCAACASQPPVQPPSPEHVARCAAVADSLFANAAPEGLPDARPPKGRPRSLLRLPLTVPAYTPVRVFYLVRPDGTGDTSLVTITGTDDPQFRRDARTFATRNQMTPAEVDGCPVWSKVVLTVTRGPVVRVKQ